MRTISTYHSCYRFCVCHVTYLIMPPEVVPFKSCFWFWHRKCSIRTVEQLQLCCVSSVERVYFSTYVRSWSMYEHVLHTGCSCSAHCTRVDSGCSQQYSTARASYVHMDKNEGWLMVGVVRTYVRSSVA